MALADITAQSFTSAQLMWGTLAVAVIVVAPRAAWRWTRYATVYVHEVGHALVAIATGRRLNSITLQANGGGLTTTTGDRPSSIPTLAAGYTAPAVAGGAIMAALTHDVSVTIISWVVLVITGCMLVMMRNLLGIFIGFLALAAWGFIIYFATPTWQIAIVTAIAWFLLVSGIRDCFDQFGQHRDGGHDASALARITHLPAFLWASFFLLISLAAGALSVWWAQLIV